MNIEQREKMRTGQGFIAALDQSGGSTPKALRLYGLPENSYSSPEEMYDLVQDMRARIMCSPAFTGQRILATILFEMTVDRMIDDRATPEYLWNERGIVPIVKVDKGLAELADGAQVMKPMPDLDRLLEHSVAMGIFGTKMRSLISLADSIGIEAVVDQQFEIGRRIIDAGLVPIIEPEIDIHSPQKSEAEALLRPLLVAQLDRLEEGQWAMLKLTLPSDDDFYAELVQHPRILRIVALSGGYSREDANALLARNHGVVASFSRALTEGLTAQLTDAEFDAMLNASIQSIYDASIT